MKKQLDQLEYKVKTLLAAKPGTAATVSASNDEDVEALKRALDNLRQEFEKHRDNTNRNLNDLNNTMPTKADKQDLLDLEARLNEKLNEILRQLLELIPNKDELNKRFAAINKKLKELFDLLDKGDATICHEDDGMFTKKPYGPANCASCDKDIVNLIG